MPLLTAELIHGVVSKLATTTMKLIVSGATGLIGTEIIRQALSNKAIDTVLALGRRETAAPGNLPPGGDPSKLKSVVCSDFTNYSDDVKRQLEGADACIW